MTHVRLSMEGMEALKKKLEGLRQERTRLTAALAEARHVKDADEFDLVDEMTQLALVEKQMDETKHLIAHSSPNIVATDNNTVQLGSTVHLETPHGILQCKVVNPVEADPESGRISDVSPLGSALLGKSREALVHIQGPRRSLTYRVLGIGTA
jgi:transcription elongation factor GreA